MILNRTKKSYMGLVFAMLMILLLSAVSSAVHAKGTSVAHISPGQSSAEGSQVQATGSTGKLTVESGGPTYSVDGMATRYNGIWPDPTVARAVGYAGKGAVTETFTATSGSKYYAEAYTQYNTKTIYAEAVVTVN
ncbi:hypothetical protein [Solibacillus sp. NPDC093137]|uniref:hypothetical protein n=1 Tax=Solibacillus sp. NPDC093137 TaxID=3390678 RepID=UPI003D05B549